MLLQVISCEKLILEQILRKFNIYVDNPCCVLTQEESKKFIQGHERDKYLLFLKVIVGSIVVIFKHRVYNVYNHRALV